MNDDKYIDMLYMQHHVSKNHPQMPILDRAAQFSPFSALPGYEAAIKERGRITQCKIKLDIDLERDLNLKLQLLREQNEKSIITIKYFVPDKTKSGGSYKIISDYILKFDDSLGVLILAKGERIPISNIYSLDGDIFKSMW